MKFFDWAYQNGDAAAAGLDYVPLPQTVKDAVRTAWHANILSPDGKPIN
jgi:phosphate transport system substrate-binding protein